MKQLELVPSPRPRVRLDDPMADAAVRAMLGPIAAPKRSRNRLAGSVTIGLSNGSRLSLSEEDFIRAANDMLGQADPDLPRSAWSEKGEKPPVVGLWEVTDHKTGTLLARWWFGGVWWVKGDPRDKVASQLTHEQFVTQYAWRGLRSPHPDVYPCPPYASAELVDRALRMRVGIKTTYVRVSVSPDGEVQSQAMLAPRWPTGLPRERVRL